MRTFNLRYYYFLILYYTLIIYNIVLNEFINMILNQKPILYLQLLFLFYFFIKFSTSFRYLAKLAFIILLKSNICWLKIIFIIRHLFVNEIIVFSIIQVWKLEVYYFDSLLDIFFTKRRFLWNIFIFINKRLSMIILFTSNFLIYIVYYIIVAIINLLVYLAHIFFMTVTKTINSAKILILLACNLQNLLRDKYINFILNVFCL